jgi:hypothetical protein
MELRRGGGKAEGALEWIYGVRRVIRSAKSPLNHILSSMSLLLLTT